MILWNKDLKSIDNGIIEVFLKVRFCTELNILKSMNIEFLYILMQFFEIKIWYEPLNLQIKLYYGKNVNQNSSMKIFTISYSCPIELKTFLCRNDMFKILQFGLFAPNI